MKIGFTITYSGVNIDLSLRTTIHNWQDYLFWFVSGLTALTGTLWWIL